MITIKLFVDQGKNRVVFAESDSDFVDVLLSFLTIPVGTVVRLCGKESNVGCMDNLYKSVESLDDDRHLQSKACKTMLLRPRNAWNVNLDNLPVKILEDTCYSNYICPTWASCIQKGHCNFSTVPNYAPCDGCGKMMRTSMFTAYRDVPAGETFIKGNRGFMITDDLQVTPLTTLTFFALLKKLDIHDVTSLKEMMVKIGRDEVLGLLKRSLLSPTPLSDVFLLKKTDNKNINSRGGISTATKKLEGHQIHCEDDDDLQKRSINVNVILNRATRNVLYVEAAGEAFIDFLFSFLTFPLGSIAKLLLDDADSSDDVVVGCLHNLYKSVQELCSTSSSSGDLILHSEKHKAILLNPKLAPYHGCKNQLLPVEEPKDIDRELTITECETCFNNSTEPEFGKCAHGILGRKISEPVNPKKKPATVDSQKDIDDESGGFVKLGSTVFMVTDQLLVERLSPVGVIKRSVNNATLCDLEHASVTIGREEALKLLKASLTSKTPLTDVFINPSRCTCQIFTRKTN